jgi:hypothetical protein
VLERMYPLAKRMLYDIGGADAQGRRPSER